MKLRYIALSIVLLQLSSLASCRRAGDGPSDGSIHTGLPDYEFYEEYPAILALEETIDEAEAFYTMGDIEYSLYLVERAMEEVMEMKAVSVDPEVCERLEEYGHRAESLRYHILREEDATEWRGHMASVLDSIGRYHVVEESIGIEMNWMTEHWLKYFQGRGRRHFVRWLERAEKYRNVIEPILVETEVPRDLLFLAVIESGLNLHARSSVNATGPWQFMAGTGKKFGLRINWWIDERKDIIASTYAAAHYLKALHGIFGKWELALASYNAGEYRVAHAISRQKTEDYWKLRLPSQTRWFVPKFMAALEIGRNPAAYGFGTPKVDPVRFDIVRVEDSTDLRHIASGAGCTVMTIKNLNPAIKRWATPPDMVVEIKVPHGTAGRVRAALAELPPGDRVSWHRHRIRRGETMSRIAERYEIAQSELKRINGISNVHSIREGAVLLIPVRDAGGGSSHPAEPAYRKPPPMPDRIAVRKYSPPEGHRKILYTVRDRDTLGEIAERFGVGLSRLRGWNDLRYRSLIHPGDNLVIYLPPGAASPEETSQEGRPGDQEGSRKKILHVVSKGETLYAISRKYRTRVSDILAWNSSLNKDRLFPGDRILIWVDSD